MQAIAGEFLARQLREIAAMDNDAARSRTVEASDQI